MISGGIFFALLAALFYGVERFWYKLVIKKDALNFTIFWYFFQVLFSGLFLVFMSQDLLRDLSALSNWSIVSGVLWALGSLLNFKSYQYLAASEKALLSRSKIIFVYFFSWFFLKELITPLMLIGVLLISLGVLLIALRREKIEMRKEGVFYALSSAFVFAAALSLDKYAIGVTSKYAYSFVIYFTSTIIILIFHFMKKKTFCPHFNKEDIRGSLIPSLLGIIAYIATLEAYKYAQASIIVPLLESSLVITVFLSVVFLKENEALLKKTLSLLLIVFGAYLLAAA